MGLAALPTWLSKNYRGRSDGAPRWRGRSPAKPNLILADDPTAGMSPGDGRRIVRLLGEMRRVGAAVVIATQDETLADCAPMQRWRIERGRLTAVDEGAPAEALE